MDVRWLQPSYIWGDCVDNLQFYLIQDLGNVLNWLRANKRTLNMTKTKFMRFRFEAKIKYSWSFSDDNNLWQSS